MDSGRPVSDEQMRSLWSSIDPEMLHRILREANERYAYQDEFSRRMTMLNAADAETAWAVLDFARRLCAHEIPSVSTNRPWFIPTPEILHWLHEIDVLSSGPLVTALDRLGDEQNRFASHALMDEAVAACLTPDEQTQSKDVRAFLRQGIRPRSRTEQLVVNFYSTMQQVPRLASIPLSMKLITQVQRMLTAGLCEEDECTSLRRKNVPRRATVDRWPGAQPAPLAREIKPTMQILIDSMNENQPWVHPLIRGMMLYFTLLNVRPFEIGEVGLARAVFQIHMHRAGYPAMQLMPISEVLLYRYREYGKLWPADNRGDLTGFVTWGLESVWHALDTLRVNIDTRVAENERLRSQLRFDPTLNHRQRTILGRAIRLQGASFYIDYHRRSYSIAYSTARADLMGLVDRGYMRVRRDGHAFVFTASPGLRNLVMQRSTAKAT